jgi:carbon monoxide dehydrogenase subunit G
MTNIESKTAVINTDAATLVAFLSDMNNVEKLLPRDKITEWKSDEKSCSFKIQNAYTIGLVFSNATADKVIYQSAPGSPFAFTLTTSIVEKDNAAHASLLCEADINPFLKMIVVNPLKNLFDYMGDRMEKIYKPHEA